MDFAEKIFERLMTEDSHNIPSHDIFVAILYELKGLNGKWDAMDFKIGEIATNAMTQQKESEDMLLKRIIALEITVEDHDKKVTRINAIKDFFGTIPSIIVVIGGVFSIIQIIRDVIAHFTK